MRAVPVILAAIVCFVLGCASKGHEEKAFEFIFKSEWDSARRYIDEGSEALKVIFNANKRIHGKYDYTIADRAILVSRSSRIVDTIRFSGGSVAGKITIDSADILKLFREESELRILVVQHFITGKQPREAWFWLIEDPQLDVDSLYGNLFDEMGYAFSHKEFATVVQRIERAWLGGHAKSGLALSEWLTLNGQRDESLRVLNKLASLSNTEAMIRLGQIYEVHFSSFGYDPPAGARPNSSYDWFMKAARLGNPYAMYYLGFIYERGISRPANLDSAWYWFRRSSEFGESSASSAIAIMHLSGTGVRHNLDSGMYWFDVAIKQDPAGGNMDLGEVYEEGFLVEKDLKKALEHYQMAQLSGSPVARQAIGRISKLTSSY